MNMRKKYTIPQIDIITLDSNCVLCNTSSDNHGHHGEKPGNGYGDEDDHTGYGWGNNPWGKNNGWG